MSFRDNDPFAELTHRAEAEGVTSATYLKRLLKKDVPVTPAHLTGSVPWSAAKRRIKTAMASLDAGKGMTGAQVRKKLNQVRTEWLQTHQGR